MLSAAKNLSSATSGFFQTSPGGRLQGRTVAVSSIKPGRLVEVVYSGGCGCMTKVVMLGISGLDADLLRVYGPSLPDMRRLLLHSPFLEMRSCFPPEPLPAWVSLYTG